MKKLLFLTLLLLLSNNTTFAEKVPIPNCACNDISAHLNIDPKLEEQTKQEIKKMDNEANKLNTSYQNSINKSKTEKQKPWWKRKR